MSDWPDFQLALVAWHGWSNNKAYARKINHAESVVDVHEEKDDSGL